MGADPLIVPCYLDLAVIFCILGPFLRRSLAEELAKQEVFLDNLHEQMKQEDGNEVGIKFILLSYLISLLFYFPVYYSIIDMVDVLRNMPQCSVSVSSNEI